MKVTILTDLSEDAKDQMIDRIYTAARCCYSGDTCEKIYVDACNNKTREQKLHLIGKVLESGHHSIIEHIHISFAIDDISRACSLQLVRHRLCTYSQASQRYIDASKSYFKYITPKDIEENEIIHKEYDIIMEQLKNFYDRAVIAGIKPEDARFILPNAACTNIVVTTNLRNLIHILGLRCCNRAQWEIRAVYQEIARKLSIEFPWLSKYLNANCEQLGYCPEGDKSCHRYPTLSELQNKPE